MRAEELFVGAKVIVQGYIVEERTVICENAVVENIRSPYVDIKTNIGYRMTVNADMLYWRKQ